MSSTPHPNIPVKHISVLANIPVTATEETTLEKAFEETLNVVEELKTVDVANVQPTFQVTGLVNVLREDVVDESRMFSQHQATQNAAATHDGYIMVHQIIAEK